MQLGLALTDPYNYLLCVPLHHCFTLQLISEQLNIIWVVLFVGSLPRWLDWSTWPDRACPLTCPIHVSTLIDRAVQAETREFQLNLPAS
jgi:hypothetical protein